MSIFLYILITSESNAAVDRYEFQSHPRHSLTPPSYMVKIYTSNQVHAAIRCMRARLTPIVL